jgi:hypothetical protein
MKCLNIDIDLCARVPVYVCTVCVYTRLLCMDKVVCAGPSALECLSSIDKFSYMYVSVSARLD